jgi:two-component system, cell cycle sensor histidine kinase and response regulator CckA
MLTMDRVEALEQQVAALERELASARKIDAHQHDSETWLRLAAEASGIGLWCWEAAGDVITWDARLCAIFQCETGPRDYPEWRARIHADDVDRVEAHVAEALRTGTYGELEHRIVRGDGVVRWIHARASVERDDTGRFVRLMGAVVDVTDRRDLEERIRHSAKMEALSRLASGIAHNFNNLLAVVIPSVDEAARVSPVADAALAPAKDAVVRAAEIVRELSRLAGDDTRARSRADLVSVVRRAVESCQARFDSSIGWDVELDLALPPVNVDAQRMEQAIVNVLTNAREALRDPASSTRRVAVRAWAESARVRVSITDTGVGMSDEVRARVFEPFFTTKGPASGAGLGLATAYAITRAHGGDIACDPRAGGGTCVTLSLPVDATSRATPAAKERPAALRGRGEKVLVVDDERLLRRVLRALLEGAGYAVIEAVDGVEALERLDATPDLALMILDRSMPNMSGAAVMMHVERDRPHLRVIGYSGLDEPLAGVRAMLTKPVEPDVLLATVRAVLDGP